MVYLGLDYGQRRIGVARSDELGIIAEPLSFIDARSRDTIKKEILGYLQTLKVGTIVVGLPKTTQGKIGKQAEAVLKFVEGLKQWTTCCIVTWDERFTTKLADQVLRETGVTPSKRKWKRDALAAQMMLQNYLDYSRDQRGSHV